MRTSERHSDLMVLPVQVISRANSWPERDKRIPLSKEKPFVIFTAFLQIQRLGTCIKIVQRGKKDTCMQSARLHCPFLMTVPLPVQLDFLYYALKRKNNIRFECIDAVHDTSRKPVILHRPCIEQNNFRT